MLCACLCACCVGARTCVCECAQETPLKNPRLVLKCAFALSSKTCLLTDCLQLEASFQTSMRTYSTTYVEKSRNKQAVQNVSVRR